MNASKISAFIYGNQKHYLDHLAPLASLLNIPLIVTDLEIEALAKTYYPDLKLLYIPPAEVGERIVADFDVVLSTLPTALLDPIFFIAENLHQKKLKYVWCPHGNSDKGHAAPYMEGLSRETFACVYGKKMESFLREKGAFDQLEKCFYLGNYRYQYYQKHKTFYETHLPFRKRGKTLLYAPTWNDGEKSSSFETAYESLIASVPKEWTLIIKPHPHLQCSIPSQENLIVLKDYPPIYPLLAQVDGYLGDMSSIGYDFLAFRRPLLFYNPQNRNPKTDKGLYLTQCGTILKEGESPFKHLETVSLFEKIQERVYNEVFEKEGTIHDIPSYPF